MTLVLTAQDVEQASDMRTMISAIEEGLREEASGDAIVPPRINITTQSGWFRLMPAVLNKRGIMGFKAFQITNGLGARYLIAIYNERDGILLALMDAHYLTAARTGATTGIGTKYLARSNARTVGVVGSGLEARTNLAAICAVREIDHVNVFSPNPERRQLFAKEMGQRLRVEITPVESPQASVDGVDIILVATVTSGRPDPISFRGEWLRPGVHINSVASTMPRQREIDAETIGRADVMVVDSKAQIEEESGDVLAAIQEGTYDSKKVFEAADVVGGKAPGRTSESQITLYKSVGTAIQDVMAGHAVYEAAKKLSLGRDLGEILDLKST